MCESDGEQAARSLALEQAYVHEVYEQCADRTVQGKHWPRIYQFLEELEPGALVCDIGCGNGKYLNVNHNVFKIGVDRCKRFTNIAREKENEVLTCDNLSLPFRDESFDAVLSIAVVHHFSTTERRVRAIKELARVLRIGGRLIISVWAMEQKHRKFESQDVLVPWPKAYCVNSSGSPMKPRGMSYDERHRSKSAQTYLLSKRNSSSGGGQRKGSSGKGKSYWIDPIFSPSPSTSSLSSPNETCYSFFRRALQKLAGGRRSSRAWFLENWQNAGSQKDRRGQHYDDEDDGYVDDLPIELRRLEEGTFLPLSSLNSISGNSASAAKQLHGQQSADSLSVKSKSLSNILDVQRLDLVRSRSSIPGLCNISIASIDEQEPEEADAQIDQKEQQQQQHQQQMYSSTSSISSGSSKPRLVKQKTHLDDTACLDVPENTAIQQLLKDIPEFQVAPSATSDFGCRTVGATKRGNVHKQSSMNEELMSIERLKERESVRRNIMKQASLNEELIYKSNNRPTFEAFKDSFYSGSATKRFQLLKSGLTNRIKQSTTNIEKVSGMAIKNGFVRILQSWKSTESPATATTATTTTSSSAEQCKTPTTPAKPNSATTITGDGIERRLSREDGSDSSKDSSLQSDTSVDSEDSFASVIYVPKKNSNPLIEAAIGPGLPIGYQLSTTSAPPSPRVKYAPDLATHRTKLVSMSPLLKQFPATSKSLPPPSPPGLSPRTLNGATMRPFFSGNEVLPQPASSAQTLLERIAEVKRSFDSHPLPRMPNLSAARTPGVQQAKSLDVEVPTTVAPTTTATTTKPTTAPKTVSTTLSPPVPVVPVVIDVPSTKALSSPPRQSSEDRTDPKRPSLQTIRGYKSMSSTLDADDEPLGDDTSPLITEAIDEALERLSEKSLSSSDSLSTATTTEDEDSRCSRLNQIKELLRQKPGFATRAKSAFPLVRRASTSASSGRLETVTKMLPRLLSLELFNPETDDLDSESSGASSPESVGSVISVISDERYASKKESVGSDGGSGEKKSEEGSSGDATDSSKDMASMSCSTKPDDLSSAGEAELSLNPSTDDSDSLIELSTGSSQSLKLLEAAANVASSLEDAVGTLIQQKTAAKAAAASAQPISAETTTSQNTTSSKPVVLDKHISPVESTWNEECKRQLTDLTDRLSENLIHDIDQFCRRTKLELDGEDVHAGLPSARTTGACKYDSGLKQTQQQQVSTGPTSDTHLDNNPPDVARRGPVVDAIQRSFSEDSDAGSSGGFVVVTNSGEFLSERELHHRQQQQQQQHKQTVASKTPGIGQQRYNNNSIESSDIGDSISESVSSSQAESSYAARRFCSGSTASLASSSLTADHGPTRVRLCAQNRSASEEIPPRATTASMLHQQRHQLPHHRAHSSAAAAAAAATSSHRRSAATSASNGTLSGSSSQESLPSDQITYHQYYHVFREGELDALINKYVENLHIISSYYDHASWCIVAEKVQVWTI